MCYNKQQLQWKYCYLSFQEALSFLVYTVFLESSVKTQKLASKLNYQQFFPVTNHSLHRNILQQTQSSFTEIKSGLIIKLWLLVNCSWTVELCWDCQAHTRELWRCSVLSVSEHVLQLTLKINWKMLFPNRLKGDMSTATVNKIRRDFWLDLSQAAPLRADVKRGLQALSKCRQQYWHSRQTAALLTELLLED